MTLEQWRSSGHFFPHQGHELFYHAEGDGPVILLIHGFPTASWDWHKVWPLLLPGRRLVALDMLGFGYSDKPRDHNYSLLFQADLHEALLTNLGVKSCHILAHDYGDTVAQELLARQADGSLSFRIESICLLNGGIFPEAHSPRLIQRLLMSRIGWFIGQLSSKRTLRRNFRAIFGPETPPSETEIDDFWALMTHNNGKAVIHRIIHYMAERRQYRVRWASVLREPPVPIRLLNGNHDPISGTQMVQRYRELAPEPDVVNYPKIGHYPQTEDPDAVVRDYLAFLHRLPRPAND